MAEKYNAKCSICDRPYYKCISCKDAIKASPYKVHTDTAEHYKVFQIIKGFSTKVYTKDEAREKFKNVDLSDLETFRPHIKDIIKDILKEDREVVEPVTESIVTVEPVVELAEEIKPVYSRKRNLKVEVEAEEKVEVETEFKVE